MTLSNEAHRQSASEISQPGLWRLMERSGEEPFQLAHRDLTKGGHLTGPKAGLDSHPFPIRLAEESSTHKR